LNIGGFEGKREIEGLLNEFGKPKFDDDLSGTG
jgi:hypothetical protein